MLNDECRVKKRRFYLQKTIQEGCSVVCLSRRLDTYDGDARLKIIRKNHDVGVLGNASWEQFLIKNNSANQPFCTSLMSVTGPNRSGPPVPIHVCSPAAYLCTSSAAILLLVELILNLLVNLYSTEALL